jgi:hypothetical protein
VRILLRILLNEIIAHSINMSYEAITQAMF